MNTRIIPILVIGLLGIGGAAHAKVYTSAEECKKISEEFPEGSPTAPAPIQAFRDCGICTKGGNNVHTHAFVDGKHIQLCVPKPQQQPDGTTVGMIGADPIKDQTAAQSRCPTICKAAVAGTSTGVWKPSTSKYTSLTQCECKWTTTTTTTPAASTKKAVEAGPLFSQADAQSKCASVCTSAGAGTWTGGWWTTVPNKMSVCECQSASPPPPLAQSSLCGKTIALKSRKGDCLHRPDSPQGVTSWDCTANGNNWQVECKADKVYLKSRKGDCLHRPEGAPSVTTWTCTANGNDWVTEFVNGKLKLRSSRAKDCLHRPDSPQGVTSWDCTANGNDWTVEMK